MNLNHLRTYFAIGAFIFTAMSVRAETMPTIVNLEYVKKAADAGAMIWDVRDAKSYLEGHIPGSVNMGDAGQVLRDPNREDFIPTLEVENLWNKTGLDVNQEIIVYGSRGNPYAYFGAYAITYFGGKDAKVFHDGIDGWKEAGNAVDQIPTILTPVKVGLKLRPNIAVTTQEMRQLFNNQMVQVIDARTPDEFKGNDIRAIRGGHIPGAINIPYEDNWKDPAAAIKLSKKQISTNAGMSLKDRLELSQLYSKLDPEKETVVYCQSGIRASETATVLKTLGFKNVKVYESSWLGWASQLSAPVDNETYLNVGLLNSRIASMQNRINQLEEQLKAKADIKN